MRLYTRLYKKSSQQILLPKNQNLNDQTSEQMVWANRFSAHLGISWNYNIRGYINSKINKCREKVKNTDSFWEYKEVLAYVYIFKLIFVL